MTSDERKDRGEVEADQCPDCRHDVEQCVCEPDEPDREHMRRMISHAKKVRNMTQTYSCPCCGDDVTVGEKAQSVFCPSCETHLSVDRDAEFERGMWHDLTTLTPQEAECP